MFLEPLNEYFPVRQGGCDVDGLLQINFHPDYNAEFKLQKMVEKCWQLILPPFYLHSFHSGLHPNLAAAIDLIDLHPSSYLHTDAKKIMSAANLAESRISNYHHARLTMGFTKSSLSTSNYIKACIFCALEVFAFPFVNSSSRNRLRHIINFSSNL